MDLKRVTNRYDNSSPERGFSLVEVMISLGVLCVVSLGVTALISMLNSQVMHVGSRSDRQSLQTQLESVLRNPASCNKNMMPISMGSTPALTLTNIKQYNDAGVAILTVIPGVGVPINSGSRLVVSSIKYAGGGGVGSPDLLGTLASLNTYSGSLVVTFAQPTNGTVGLKPIVIPSISIKTTLAGVFQNCEVASEPALLCAQLGMVWNAVTSVCSSSLAAACSVLGGTVVGTTCVPPNIISKQCGSGTVLSGFGSLGEIVCVAAASAPAPGPSPSPLPVPGPGPSSGPGPAPSPDTSCPGGSSIEWATDRSNSCPFTWNSAAFGASQTVNSASGGGNATGTCGPNKTWNFTFQCPSTRGGPTADLCIGGGQWVESLDKTNNCYFAWSQGTLNAPANFTSKTNGGTASGTCLATGWNFSNSCPGAAPTCPAGAGVMNASDGGPACSFVYSAAPVGTSVNVNGTPRGRISAVCAADGTWNVSVQTCP